MTKQFLYSRERKIALTIDDIESSLLLIALSAKEKELMLVEAQKNYSEIVKQLAEAADSIRAVYQLQTVELLMEALLHTERDKFLAKAVMTLPVEAAEDKEHVATKADFLMRARREELAGRNKEEIIDTLVAREMERQVHNAWACAVLEATLVRTLHDDKRQRLFDSVDELKSAVTPEVLEQLYEALTEFLADSGNAQVFLKPHISRG